LLHLLFYCWCAKSFPKEIKANKIITPRRGKAVVLIFFNPLAVGKKAIKGGSVKSLAHGKVEKQRYSLQELPDAFTSENRESSIKNQK